jgi:hypothetical protein
MDRLGAAAKRRPKLRIAHRMDRLGAAAKRRPKLRFRKIQARPKDLRALPEHSEPAVAATAGSGEEPMLDLRRRQFITLLSGAAAARPRSARAQQATTRVIGVLGSATAREWAPSVDAFLRGLRETGFAEGRDSLTDRRGTGEADPSLPFENQSYCDAQQRFRAAVW